MKRRKHQLKTTTTTTANLIKPQVCHSKCSSMPRCKRPGAQACVGSSTHDSRLLLHRRIQLVVGNLVHASAITAVHLTEVLILRKSVLGYLPRGRGTEARNGLKAPQTDWAWAGLLRLESPGGSAPHSPAQPGQDYHVRISSTAICPLVAWKESNGAGCCLLAYKCGFKEQSTENVYNSSYFYN